VDALICGLEKNSQHGFHVHEFGDLTGTDRTTNTGGHWNPTGANHAYPPSTSRHYGDMGNITVNDGGLATFMKSFDLLTLNGVNSIVGRAVVLHEKADDGQGATGNAGNKLGTCTIGYVSTLPALPATCVFSTSSLSSQNAISFVFIFISALILLVY
jgi:superoxide dismutase, Cu-Zn family